MSQTHGSGSEKRTETWVEARGDLFVTDPFLEPAVPATLADGIRHPGAGPRAAVGAPRRGDRGLGAGDPL